MEKGTYVGANGAETTHLWLSQDLLLAIAGTEHPAIQSQIINDLNRLTAIANTLLAKPIQYPSLPGHVPGTTENKYREEGLIDSLTALHMGYYSISRVTGIAYEQKIIASREEEKTMFFDPMVYSRLHATGDYTNHPTLRTDSRTNAPYANLYHHEVLKEVFPSLDLSSLV